MVGFVILPFTQIHEIVVINVCSIPGIDFFFQNKRTALQDLHKKQSNEQGKMTKPVGEALTLP